MRTILIALLLVAGGCTDDNPQWHVCPYGNGQCDAAGNHYVFKGPTKPDLSVAPDLAELPDMAAAPDLCHVDEAVAPDLVQLPDMVQLPDLVPACGVLGTEPNYASCHGGSDGFLAANHACGCCPGLVVGTLRGVYTCCRDFLWNRSQIFYCERVINGLCLIDDQCVYQNCVNGICYDGRKGQGCTRDEQCASHQCFNGLICT